MEGIRPTGLMTVPPQTADPEGIRADAFAQRQILGITPTIADREHIVWRHGQTPYADVAD